LPFTVVGREPVQGPFAGVADFSVASPGYFETFRIAVLRGRAIGDRDTASSPGAIVVNQAFAEAFFGGTDALGQRVLLGGRLVPIIADEPEREIVGIVADVRNRGPGSAPVPTVYVPQAQLPDAFNTFFVGSIPMAWVVRTAGDPATVVRPLEDELRRLTGVPVVVETMESIASLATSRERFNMLLMSVFGGAALLLAALGIYGLLAYSVQQRARELGIRIALGAEPQRIREMILRQGGALVATGVAGGVVAAFYLSSSLTSVLFEVQPRDGLTFAAVPLVLAGIGLLIVGFVALRAGRVDPLQALRNE
jgi:hypothetical protein